MELDLINNRVERTTYQVGNQEKQMVETIKGNSINSITRQLIREFLYRGFIEEGLYQN